MAKKIAPLLPSSDALLQQFGERLRLARLRRGLTARQVCERAGMAPMTLRSLERGGSGVTIGAYLAVMQVLGIEQDVQLLAQADAIGRSLQDARLPAPRAPGTRAAAQPHPRSDIPAPTMQEMARLAKQGNIKATALSDRTGNSVFISSDSLANLISATPAKQRK